MCQHLSCPISGDSIIADSVIWFWLFTKNLHKHCDLQQSQQEILQYGFQVFYLHPFKCSHRKHYLKMNEWNINKNPGLNWIRLTGIVVHVR